MKPSFQEKLLAFIIVMLGTGGFIFLSMHMVTGALEACK